MFGLPEWVIGVGALITLIAVLQVASARLLPPEYRRRRLKGEPLEGLDDLPTRLQELDQLNQRVGELEERVDFAERLLAKQREVERLGPS